MSPKLTTQHDRTDAETFIIAKTDDGFRVHSPSSPAKIHLVTGTPEEPVCTCLEFQAHEVNPDYRCKHILAVEARFGADSADEEGTDPIAAQERRAIQEEGASSQPARRTRSPKPTNGIAQMLLKRSVSPDGRIDSLSVEFTTPVEKLTAGEIREQAVRILALQDGIAGGFRNGRHEKETNEALARDTVGNGSVPAKLLDIAGMNGKWGRRLFITVQVNGETLKLFGNRSQLAEAIEATGSADFGDVKEGLRLNVPCRVTTKPSPDGRYTNVDRVFPPPSAPQRRTR